MFGSILILFLYCLFQRTLFSKVYRQRLYVLMFVILLAVFVTI